MSTTPFPAALANSLPRRWFDDLSITLVERHINGQRTADTWDQPDFRAGLEVAMDAFLAGGLPLDEIATAVEWSVTSARARVRNRDEFLSRQPTK